MNSLSNRPPSASTASTIPASREHSISHPLITIFMVLGMGLSLVGMQGLGRPAPGTLVPADDAHMGIFSIGVVIFLVTWVVAIFVTASTRNRGWILATIFLGPVGALPFGVLGPRNNEPYVLSPRRKAIGGTAVVSLALIFISGFTYFSNVAFEGPKAAYRQSFAPAISRYANISVDPSTIPNADTFGGKFVIIDKPQNTLDENLLFDARFDGLRAASPDEVVTIIWLKYREDVVGTYQSGAKGYEWFVDLTFIQASTSQAIGQVELSGSTPPDTKYGTADWHGSKPSDSDIINAILAAHTS